MPRMGKWLVNSSHIGFLLLYIYAAAAYGLTRDAQVNIFDCGMGLVFVLWLAGNFLRRRLPSTGSWPWVISIIILIFGWSVTVVGLISEGIDNDQLSFVETWFPRTLLTEWCSYYPGLSLLAMIHVTILLAGMLIAIDLWSDPWRGRILLLTMIFSSFGMVLLLILQRVIGPPFILSAENGKDIVAFATYRYHGNSGAYLNLFWPISAAVAIFAAIRQTSAWPFWFIPFVLSFMAAFINISKAGNVLAVCGIAVFLVLAIPFISREIKHSSYRIRRSRVLVAAVPLVVIIVSLPFGLPWKRWDYLIANDKKPGSRIEAYEQFSKIIPDAGIAGFGPGTFGKIYRSYIPQDSALYNQSYWVAHEDYIQTLIEWGYFGTFLWGIFLLPPTFFLLMGSFQKSEKPSKEFAGYRIGLFAHLKAIIVALPAPCEAPLAAGALTAVTLTALHSVVDFPMQVMSLQFYFLVLLALGWSYRLKPKKAAQINNPAN